MLAHFQIQFQFQFNLLYCCPLQYLHHSSFMGQEPVHQNKTTQKFLHHLFQPDPRLAEQHTFVPELFSGVVELQITTVHKLKDSIPELMIEGQIIDGINERFVIREKQNPLLSMQPQSNSPQQKPETKKVLFFHELKDIKSFYSILQKLQYLYYVSKQLEKIMRSQNNSMSRKITVRKKVNPNYESSLGYDLFARGYLTYYLLLLKRNLASKNERKKKFVGDFHSSIGRMICEMIENNHFGEEQMLRLFYKMVLMDKVHHDEGFEEELRSIKEEFWPFYLQKQHTLTLSPSRCDHLRQISRCYLDELYLRSIKEAQDPEIIIDGNEGLGIIKNFPIVRVKDKNK